MKPEPLDEAALRRWPLPVPGDDADKDERGRVLLIAGSREMPGAAVLAAVAAMRAGAGKLQIAVPACIAPMVAAQVLEARVIALPETAAGTLDAAAAFDTLRPFAERAHAVLAGPGMEEGDTVPLLVRALLAHLPHAPVVLDAGAMNVVCHASAGTDTSAGASAAAGTPPASRLPDRANPGFDHQVLLTPHAGEMARLCGVDKAAVLAAPERIAIDAARRWNAVVALKGPDTVIASPDGRAWRHEGGNAGLATSGSGDTLAGIVAGLACRGATLEQACAWGVVLHALAGEELARRIGTVGFLAREIPDCIPGLLTRLSTPAPGG